MLKTSIEKNNADADMANFELKKLTHISRQQYSLKLDHDNKNIIVKKYAYLTEAIDQLLSADDLAPTFASAHPILFWVIAKEFSNSKINVDNFKQIIRSKINTIISEFIPCCTNKNILNKIILENFTEQDFDMITLFLRTIGNHKKLAHVRHLHFDIIKFLMHERRLLDLKITFKLIDNSNNISILCHKLKLLLDVVRLVDQVYDKNTFIQLSNISSWNALIGFRDYYFDQQFERQMVLQAINENSCFFPTCYLRGNKHIQQITNIFDLEAEAQEMHHCVLTRAQEIYEGKIFIFKMFYPERATLEVDIQGCNYAINDFKLKNNQETSQKSWEYAKDWVNGLVI